VFHGFGTDCRPRTGHAGNGHAALLAVVGRGGDGELAAERGAGSDFVAGEHSGGCSKTGSGGSGGIIMLPWIATAHGGIHAEPLLGTFGRLCAEILHWDLCTGILRRELHHRRKTGGQDKSMPELSLEHALSAVTLVGIRCVDADDFCPIFQSCGVPVRVKAGLALALTILLFRFALQLSCHL